MSDPDELQLDFDPRAQLSQLLKVLRRGWFTLVGWTAAGVLLGIGLFHFLPKSYASFTKLMIHAAWVEDKDQRNELSQLPMAQRSRNVEDLLKSSLFIEEVLDRLEWAEWVAAKKRGDAERLEMVAKVKERLRSQVFPGEAGERLIFVSFEWSSREKARDFTREIRNHWLSFVAENYREELTRSVEVANEIQKKLTDDRNAMIENKKRFQAQKPVPGSIETLTEQRMVLQGKSFAINQQIAGRQQQVDELERKLLAVGPDGNPLIPPTNISQIQEEDPMLAGIRVQMDVLAKEIETLKIAGFTDKWFQVEGARKKLARFQTLYEVLGGSSAEEVQTEEVPNPAYLLVRQQIDTVRAQLRMEDAERAQLDQDLAKVENDSNVLPGLLSQLDEFEREIANLNLIIQEHNANYQSLRDRFSALQQRGESLLPYEILEEPALASSPSTQLGWVAFGITVMVFLGIALVLLLGGELLKTSFSSAEQAKKTLRLPVLGETPHIQTPAESRRHRVLRALQVAASMIFLLGLGAVIYVCVARPELVPLRLREWASQLRNGLV